MNTNLHLVFPGTCREAFAFYGETFKSKIQMTMKFGDVPPGMSAMEDAKDLNHAYVDAPGQYVAYGLRCASGPARYAPRRTSDFGKQRGHG